MKDERDSVEVMAAGVWAAMAGRSPHAGSAPSPQAQHYAKAALAALEAHGYAVVPVEPTELMSNEGYDAASRAAMKPGIAYVGAGELVWEAMLKAARPSPLP